MKALLFFLILSILILGTVIVNQVALAQSCIGCTNQTNQTIAAGPNTTVLFSANSTGFDPLTQQGTLMMVGQVMNIGNESSENTNVTTELMDFNGTLAGFNTVTTVPATIPPNGTANFQTTFADQDIIGGTPNVLFYQHTPDNGDPTGKFLGFVPPPFLGFGAGAALMQAGVPLGPGGGFAPGGGGFIGGGGGGGSGGGGGGGTTITHVTKIYQNIKQCIQNQANAASDVGGDVRQSNRAVCNIDGIYFELPEPTIPIILPPSVLADKPIALGEPGQEPKDGKCNDGQTPVDNKCPATQKPANQITPGKPGGPPVNGKCDDGQKPVDNKCPQTPGQKPTAPGAPGAEPRNGKCDDGQAPVNNRCPTTAAQTPQQSLRAQLDAQQLQRQAAVPQEDDPCLSDDPPDNCPSTDNAQQRNALQQDNTASQGQTIEDTSQSEQQATVDNPTQEDDEDDDE